MFYLVLYDAIMQRQKTVTIPGSILMTLLQRYSMLESTAAVSAPLIHYVLLDKYAYVYYPVTRKRDRDALYDEIQTYPTLNDEISITVPIKPLLERIDATRIVLHNKNLEYLMPWYKKPFVQFNALNIKQPLRSIAKPVNPTLLHKVIDTLITLDNMRQRTRYEIIRTASSNALEQLEALVARDKPVNIFIRKEDTNAISRRNSSQQGRKQARRAH